VTRQADRQTDRQTCDKALYWPDLKKVHFFRGNLPGGIIKHFKTRTHVELLGDGAVELLHTRAQVRPHPGGVLVGRKVRPGGVGLQGGAVRGGVVLDVGRALAERVDEERVQLEGTLV
jgi:hypothetical protein